MQTEAAERGPPGEGGDELDRAGSNSSGSNFSDRLNRYGAAKRRSGEQAKFIGSLPGTREARLANRVSSCGGYLWFRHYYTVDELRLAGARFCQLPLLCPFCAIRRGSKALGSYLNRWQVVKAEKPALRPFLVTLTVKNGGMLSERLRHLQGAHRRLWKRRNNRDYGHSVMASVEGGVWSYEVKRGKGSGLWHPHVHGIWLAEDMPDAAALSAEWLELTGDSHRVDVRPIVGDEAEGFCEVFKYALKFSDMTTEDTWSAFQVLRGERLMDSAGVFRGVHVPDELTDDMLDGLPYMDRFFGFDGTSYREVGVEESPAIPERRPSRFAAIMLRSGRPPNGGKRRPTPRLLGPPIPL